MAQVSVKDVGEIHTFANSLKDFRYSYIGQLTTIGNDCMKDIEGARQLVNSIENVLSSVADDVRRAKNEVETAENYARQNNSESNDRDLRRALAKLEDMQHKEKELQMYYEEAKAIGQNIKDSLLEIKDVARGAELKLTDLLSDATKTIEAAAETISQYIR
ncbi:MAG: hypothetical protein KBT06_06175 [Prevotellaceae bacterium]|nr:hypothetical protein [Candidatus Colivivens equi]